MFLLQLRHQRKLNRLKLPSLKKLSPHQRPLPTKLMRLIMLLMPLIRLRYLKHQHLFKLPNLRVHWWPCAAMTVLVKRNPCLRLQAEVVLATAVMASPVRALTKAALATKRAVDLTVAIVQNVKTGDLALAMPPLERSAMPKSTPKWPCANWLYRLMVNP
jgi:hypothetical protein